jgi:hypothetical protein
MRRDDEESTEMPEMPIRSKFYQHLMSNFFTMKLWVPPTSLEQPFRVKIMEQGWAKYDPRTKFGPLRLLVPKPDPLSNFWTTGQMYFII